MPEQPSFDEEELAPDEASLQDDEDSLYEHHRIVVDKGQAQLRIDKFLIDRLANTSRNRIQSGIKDGLVRVNDKETKANYKVKPLDIITIVLPTPPRNDEILAENIPLNIAFEDDHLLIVNKVAGMVVHPAYSNWTGTLVNALVYHFEQLPTHRNGSARPGLVHRIDKDTSGLVVIAKTDEAMTYLARQFFDHSIERTYYALVWGDVKEDSGTITGHIGRSIRDRKVMAVYPKGEVGKHAVTHYKVLERLGYVTLVQCNLETGRTHQIRAHMQHIGHPLFNDATYGGDRIVKGEQFSKYKQFVENTFKILPRQALHAKTIGFKHPLDQRWVQLDSNLPDDISEALDRWRSYTRNHDNE